MQKHLHFAIFILTMIGFLALSYYSQKYVEHSDYTRKEVQSLNDLTERVTAKPVSALTIRQARAYAEIYVITDADKAINIWGEK